MANLIIRLIVLTITAGIITSGVVTSGYAAPSNIQTGNAAYQSAVDAINKYLSNPTNDLANKAQKALDTFKISYIFIPSGLKKYNDERMQLASGLRKTAQDEITAYRNSPSNNASTVSSIDKDVELVHPYIDLLYMDHSNMYDGLHYYLVLVLREKALTAISQYVTGGSDSSLLTKASAAVQMVKPYDNTQITAGIGAYSEVSRVLARAQKAQTLYSQALSAINQYRNSSSVDRAIETNLYQMVNATKAYNDIKINNKGIFDGLSAMLASLLQDKQNFYEKAKMIYSPASDAINQYRYSPIDHAKEASLRQMVNALIGYNGVKFNNNVGAYDDLNQTLTQLIQSKQAHLDTAQSIYSNALNAINQYRNTAGMDSNQEANIRQILGTLQKYNDVLNSKGQGYYDELNGSFNTLIQVKNSSGMTLYNNAIAAISAYNANPTGNPATVANLRSLVDQVLPYNNIKTNFGLNRGLYDEALLDLATILYHAALQAIDQYSQNTQSLEFAKQAVEFVRPYNDLLKTGNDAVGIYDRVLGLLNAAMLAKQSFLDKAKAAIDNYFKVLTSGQDATSAQTAMTASRNALTNPSDVAAANTYYDQANHVYSGNVAYQKAVNAINSYSKNPNSDSLSQAVQLVMLVKPYKDIQVTANGLGLYDDATNRLIQAVMASMLSTHNLMTINQLADSDNSFSTTVAAIDGGSVFISNPGISDNVSGVIYVFNQDASGHWVKSQSILPVTSSLGDHFGRVFVVKNGTLIASSEPKDGKAKVYLFTKTNGWTTNNFLDLTSNTSISTINKMTLGLAPNTIVVGLPEYGKYLIYDQVCYYSASTNQLTMLSWRLAVQDSFNSVPGPVAVAADGDCIVVGTPSYAKENPISDVRILSPVQVSNPIKDGNGVVQSNTISHDWSIENEGQYSGTAGLGQSVAVTQDPTGSKTIVAIGSPLENNNQGAVYTITKTVEIGPNSRTVGFTQNMPVPLMMSSLNSQAGTALALQGQTLMVSAALKQSTPSDPVSTAMVYHLDNTNQWVWDYNINTASSNSLAVNGNTVVIGSLVTPATSNQGASQVTVISPKK